jgi:hypothetical protein
MENTLIVFAAAFILFVIEGIVLINNSRQPNR